MPEAVHTRPYSAKVWSRRRRWEGGDGERDTDLYAPSEKTFSVVGWLQGPVDLRDCRVTALNSGPPKKKIFMLIEAHGQQAKPRLDSLPEFRKRFGRTARPSASRSPPIKLAVACMPFYDTGPKTVVDHDWPKARTPYPRRQVNGYWLQRCAVGAAVDATGEIVKVCRPLVSAIKLNYLLATFLQAPTTEDRIAVLRLSDGVEIEANMQGVTQQLTTTKFINLYGLAASATCIEVEGFTNLGEDISKHLQPNCRRRLTHH